MFDIIIIGGGPAGLSAAVAAKNRNKDVLLIGNGIESSALYKAERVNNYLGMPEQSGAEMMRAFYDHAVQAGVSMVQGKAQQMMSMGESYSVGVGVEFYEARTVILASGLKKGGQLDGAERLVGKGVSYCATCDGMLYRGKTVALIGENEESAHDAKFLSEICEKVYYITKRPPSAEAGANIEYINEKPLGIGGEKKADAIRLAERTIDCDGVFIIEDSLPAQSLIYGIEMADGFIQTDKSMATNLPGLFAAGDCTGKPLQIAKAVGEGLTAALSAVEYLAQH